jgi:predicted RNase H-like HicB family nuclease
LKGEEDVQLTVRIRQEDDGYWADVEQLPRCFASGSSLDELAEALSEAIQLYTQDEDDVLVGPDGNDAPDRPAMQIDEMKVLV